MFDIGTSPTASIPSRGRRDQDQVASINWHPIFRLQRSKSSSPTPKQDPTECHAYRRHSRPRLLHRSNTDLTIADVRDVPVEITGGLRIDRHDLRSTHEEADILIAQHAISLSLLGKYVRGVCNDTYVFVLLVHYYNSRCKCSNSASMTMLSPVQERAVIYFRATVESRSDIADDLLAIHGLSGADAVASLHGIGKSTVVKVTKKGCFPLFCIGDVHAEIKSVEAQASKFMCTGYGKVAESCSSMTECRVKMWRSKTGKSGASSVKLCSIPPTTESFTENVHRCHLQVAIWKAALI